MKKITLLIFPLLFCLVSCGSSVSGTNTGNIDNTTDNPAVSEKSPPPVSVEIPVGAVGMGPQAFGKNPLTVPIGTTVTWTNKDTLNHIIAEVYEKFGSSTLKPGQTYSHTFQELGEFYYADVRYGYDSMSGMVKVVERVSN